jgi:hypothetical protein
LREWEEVREMDYETRKGPEETKSGERLTNEDIRELFERYGNREPRGPALTTESVQVPEHPRELLMSER